MANLVCSLTILYLIHLGIVTSDLTKEPGHLQRFGTGRPIKNVDQMEGSPFTKAFFNDYVKYRKPLLMKGAVNMSRAFRLWTDEYFLGTDDPEGHRIVIDRSKDETKWNPNKKNITLKEFIMIYNTTDLYMTHGIPKFLESDVLLPGPLQCPVIQETVVHDMLWISSGGTKSVVHFDPYDIMHCVLRGHKEFILVESKLFRDKVGFDDLQIDRSSHIVVDRMDYLKYPGLAEIEYHKAVVEAGDCFYLPYHWVHQVRSYSSNVAVSIMWDAYLPQDLDEHVDQCLDVFDPDLTVDKVKMIGFHFYKRSTGTMRDYFLDWTEDKPMDFEELLNMFLYVIEDLSDTEHFDFIDPERNYKIPMKKIFHLLEQNNDDLLEQTEVQSTTEEVWKVITKQLVKEFEKRLDGIETEWWNRDTQENIQKKQEL